MNSKNINLQSIANQYNNSIELYGFNPDSIKRKEKIKPKHKQQKMKSISNKTKRKGRICNYEFI